MNRQKVRPWPALLLLSLLLAAWQAPGSQADDRAAITIAEARALPLGTTVTVEGIVTVAAGTYNAGFAIQDAMAGIYVYPGSFVGVQLGEAVRITGPLAGYNCLLQVAPTAGNVQRTGMEAIPDPLPRTTGQIGEASEGWLVVITGTVSGLPAKPFFVDDGSGAAEVYVDTDTGISLAQVTNGSRVRIAGHSMQYDGSAPCDRGWQVQPRRQSDVTLLDSTPPAVVATLPAGGAAGASPHKPVEATFDEALMAATVNAGTFRLQGPGGAVNGAVRYDAATRRAVLLPGSALAPNSLHTATLTTGIQDTAGNALAGDYAWTFTTGPPDTTPPAITGRAPAPGATDVAVTANVVVNLSEELNPATVTADHVLLSGPFGPVPAALAYDAAAATIILDPTANLLPHAQYQATIQSAVADWAGLTLGADEVWTFETAGEPAMQVYHGDIHNHTAISDGSGTPAQALAAGRAAGLQFMAISDHSYSIDDAEWAGTLAAVEAATEPGQFVALRGFEYTQGAEGHANVYNTARHAVRSQVAGCTACDFTPNLEVGATVDGFYHWVEVTGTLALDTAGTLLQFNHPGWINFNDWTYHPEVGATARLEEVGNGSGTSYVFAEEEYIRSLDYGWRLGATNNADSHSATWGTNTEHRTGAWLPALTKADLMDALRARRTFASEDRNYALHMKANGAWMGSQMANSGQVAFDIAGQDPDGEPTSLVQVIGNGGQVLAEETPGSATFAWQPVLAVAPGIHYYYVKAVQPDGDRIVSSPVWTVGTEDVSISDLTVQPSIPTIHNPSLLTARVTNRGPSAWALTVVFEAGGGEIGRVGVTAGPCPAGPCDDAFASVAWQPAATGPVRIAARLEGAPAADSPDDNERSLALAVTDEAIPLVLVDSGHNNVGAMPRDARTFTADLTAHGYNVLHNLDTITPGDLNTQTVKLLILNAFGPTALSAAETEAIAAFVADGGSLWLNGMSDYAGKVAWADTVAERMNALVAAVEARTGTVVPIRLNDDEVLDGDDNNGYPWGVLWHDFPAHEASGVGLNVTQIQSWSDCSLTDRGGGTLTAEDLGADGFLFVRGDLDTGTGTYGYPNRTSGEDADNQGDATLYPSTTPVAAAAGYDLPGAAGRLFFYGDSNDPFNIFAYTAGDGKQNELFNLEAVLWLLGTPLQPSTVAEARNIPDRLHELVWVEGEITAGYGEFFNVLYLEDESGGITVHAPAGDIYAGDYARGARVRAVGTVGTYNGDTEIEFFEAEQVAVLAPATGAEPPPLPLSTHDAALEINEGRLVQVTGTVVAWIDSSAVIVDDGSGPVRAFLDGYNGSFAGVGRLDRVTISGLVSEDGEGRRIRVRNHGAHAALPDDVVVLARAAHTYLPLVVRGAAP